MLAVNITEITTKETYYAANWSVTAPGREQADDVLHKQRERTKSLRKIMPRMTL